HPFTSPLYHPRALHSFPHDALPICPPADFDYEFEGAALRVFSREIRFDGVRHQYALDSLLRVLLSWKLLGHHGFLLHATTVIRKDRKSTRLNSSHVAISYAVFCLKK